MEHRLKKTAIAAALVMATAWFADRTDAAAPDGNGPWADTVVGTAQGLRKDGSAVPAPRSDATSMLGVAEETLAEGTFYSLGFGGEATLGFDNGFADAVLVIESTFPGYPIETADVEVSENGTDWLAAGSVQQDGTVTVPDRTLCVQYVRLTDTSNPALFEDTADGYDVDGVSAYGRTCSNDGKMTGGGSFFDDGKRITHGMELACDGSSGHLQVNWGKGEKFHLTSLEDAFCEDNPALDPGSPEATFDMLTGHGLGKYNGTDGYHAYFKFTDDGEPGTGDTAWIQIWNPDHSVKVQEFGVSYLDKGNQQAH